MFFLIDHLCIFFGEGLCKYFDHFLIGIVLKYCCFLSWIVIFILVFILVFYIIYLDTVYFSGTLFEKKSINSFHYLIMFLESTHIFFFFFSSVQFSHSVVSDSLQPNGLQHASLPVHHQLSEFTQTHVHWVGDAIQPSHPLSSPSPPTFNLSQHQGFFKWVSSSYQVAKVLEFQLQHQSFQWTPRTDLL